jgi:DNA-3-methyladenine glycosylase I
MPMERCAWLGDDPLMMAYHDDEWGVPLHDDRRHFEFLVLDAFQAGLSWRTVLNKRENFRAAFDGFDPSKIVRYGDTERARLLADAGIIRNRQKVDATIGNARAFLDIQQREGGFDGWVWQFTDGGTIQNSRRELTDIPPKTAEAEAMSKALKAEGFRFVGPTICYAYMQAAGMVNDHVTRCYRWPELGGGS